MEAFSQDVGSETDVMVDGQPLEKNKEVAVGVGAKLTFGGSETVYQVRSDTLQLTCCVSV